MLSYLKSPRAFSHFSQTSNGRQMGFLCYYILCALFLLLHCAHSRNVPPPTTPQKTTLFDVAASIQETLNVMSSQYSPSQLEHQTFTVSSSSLSLPLHSRTSLGKAVASGLKDYKSLLQARLERDSVRVRSLNARLDLAVRGVAAMSDLTKPVGSGGGAFAGPIVSGSSQGSGEYFSRVGIGSPARQYYVVLDTGSDVSWVQCAPCADCYHQVDPMFEPASSASFAPMSCGAKRCQSLEQSACRNDTCLYEVSYGDGSFTLGDFATETISIGGGSVSDVAIGCGHSNEGLFVGAAGLLGLGAGALSFPSQLNATSFSYCLMNRDSDSVSTLEFNSAVPPTAVTAPLLRNPKLHTFHYVGVTGISVSGEMLDIDPTAFEIDERGNGGVIIDSGTAVTRLQRDAYDALRDAFVSGTEGLKSVSGIPPLFDTCYDLSSEKSIEVPTLSFHFADGKALPLPAKNYLIAVDSQGTFCLAFSPTSASGMSIIGNVQQQGTRVSFDIANSVIGFSPNQC